MHAQCGPLQLPAVGGARPTRGTHQPAKSLKKWSNAADAECRKLYGVNPPERLANALQEGRGRLCTGNMGKRAPWVLKGQHWVCNINKHKRQTCAGCLPRRRPPAEAGALAGEAARRAASMQPPGVQRLRPSARASARAKLRSVLLASLARKQSQAATPASQPGQPTAAANPGQLLPPPHCRPWQRRRRQRRPARRHAPCCPRTPGRQRRAWRSPEPRPPRGRPACSASGRWCSVSVGQQQARSSQGAGSQRGATHAAGRLPPAPC